ncbi:MAG: formylglycine-generating enzyme family protein [Opitutales bacterium]|nr:formylglycine-generating enzyme family protein [Opitutales bacterium]
MKSFIELVKIPNKNYSIGKYPVTQAEYKAIMGENPSHFRGGDRPVENVSWHDVCDFCKKLTARERALGRLPKGFKYRLPTSEEWEVACRAGTTTWFGSGDTEEDLARVAWYYKNSEDETHPVGQKAPNAWGIYDMHGNVWEWCMDYRDSGRVCRGGSCDSDNRDADYCESSHVNVPSGNPNYRDRYRGFRVVLAPVGQFEGCGQDPFEIVAIPGRNFSIGKYEVTQKQYEAIMGKNPSRFRGEDRPVECVSWHEACDFCQRLTVRERAAGRLPESLEYRLPTSEEWEVACRAGTTTRFCSGDTEADLARVAWYDENSEDETHPVGQKAPNAWGIYDMHGNVWEWCMDYRNYWDWGSNRIVRGGSWYNSANFCKSSCDNIADPVTGSIGIGFRVVLAPVGQ